MGKSKASVNARELSFTAKKNKCCTKAITAGGAFKLVASVTWSTLGEPLLYSILGPPNAV